MVELKNITLTYPQKVILNEVNATFNAGELVALIGRNGSGKSTLLRAVAALNRPQGGDILIDGESIYNLSSLQRAKMVSFVTTERVRIPNLLCQDIVAMGRAPYTNWLGRMQPVDAEIVAASLDAVGMASYSHRAVEGLSDGELQRIMIARALAQQTPIILLDEPTAFLDMPSRYELAQLLSSLAKSENKAILFSTHELDIALRNCDKVALVDSPNLHLLPASELLRSGLIERVFGVNIATQQ